MGKRIRLVLWPRYRGFGFYQYQGGLYDVSVIQLWLFNVAWDQ